MQERGSRRLEPIALHIEGAAQFAPEGSGGITEGERVPEAVECIIAVGRGDRRCQQAANRKGNARFHVAAAPAAGLASANLTSNSVQSPSERTSRSSPPCRRANSRARFSPRPCPGILPPLAPR